jgi:hypothetical protein
MRQSHPTPTIGKKLMLNERKHDHVVNVKGFEKSQGLSEDAIPKFTGV